MTSNLSPCCVCVETQTRGFSHYLLHFGLVELSNKKDCSSLFGHVNRFLFVLSFTGTTDAPKGVMLSHGNIIANVSAVMYQMAEYTIRMDDICMSYLPLAHMFARCCEVRFQVYSAKLWYFQIHYFCK